MIFTLRTSTSCARFCKLPTYPLLVPDRSVHKADGPPSPFSIGIDGLHNSILSDLVLRYSPQYYTFMANSTNVVFDNFDISGFSSSSNVAKNTDGWDTYRSSDITIMNSVINNGDGTSAPEPPLPVAYP